jgi:hypothetical protein
MPRNTFLEGNQTLYLNQKHLLNYTKDLKKINLHKICEYADFHNWHWDLRYGDINCNQLKHSFFILIYKTKFINKLNENFNFIPDLRQTSLGRENISREEALKLQDIILEINLKKFIKEIKFPNSLGYLGVAMYVIGEEIENENKKVTRFLIEEFKKIIASIKNRFVLNIINNDENIKRHILKLDEIYYNGIALKCWDLAIFEEIFNILKNQNPKNNFAI